MSWLRGYKKIFMLNSAEHEILNAYSYKRYEEIKHFSGSDFSSTENRRKVESSRLSFAIRRQENSLCQPSSKWVSFSN